jgi:23S rRNA pseudouridine1911/1915/1917 synthase
MPESPFASESEVDRPASRLIRLNTRHRGVRLDIVLAAELELSRAQIRRLLASEVIRLDGRLLGLADKGMPSPGSGALEVTAWRAPADQVVRPEPMDTGPRVLASGPGWLAVDKPAGMPVHPLRDGEAGTVLGHVAARHPEIHGVGEGGLRSGVVHRLDVDTSGVLLIATEQVAWRRLREAFQTHRVEKTYRAIVAGNFAPIGGGLVMELPLVVARHRPAFVRVASEEEIRRGRARVIRQSLRPIEALRDATLVEVRPTTGFLHQIRASLAHLGHPLLGDGRYAEESTALRAPRHMLHAARVRLDEIDATANDAADFAACIDGLRD